MSGQSGKKERERSAGKEKVEVAEDPFVGVAQPTSPTAGEGRPSPLIYS